MTPIPVYEHGTWGEVTGVLLPLGHDVYLLVARGTPGWLGAIARGDLEGLSLDAVPEPAPRP